MAGIYFPDMLDVLRSAGCQVGENDITAGWQTRSRKSGGFPLVPLGVVMHHTASQTSVTSDLTWMIRNCPERPVGNVLLDREGIWWPIAAGASNCAGRGGPWPFSRGVCPRDLGNTYVFQVEAQNGGTAQPWPIAQINSYLQGVLALNRRFGNQATDVVSHHAYAPTRKIDPARADAVEGAWQPSSSNRSGTWHIDDIRNELAARAGAPPVVVEPPPVVVEPPPTQPPPTQENEWMAHLPTIKKGSTGDYVERMQHLLAAAGYMDASNVRNYDGVWGDGTEKAKVNFDNAHGLAPSPPTDCGPKSWESLMTGKKW